MKLCTNQSIPCEYLKGACIFLSDEDEGRYIKDVCVDLEKHSIILIDDDGNGLYWESLRNASIQFQGGRQMKKLFSKLLKKPKNLIVVPFKLPTTTDLSKEALHSMEKRALDRLKGLSNE